MLSKLSTFKSLFAGVLTLGMLGATASYAADPLRVGYLQFTSYGTVSVSEANGWFEDAGLDVELVLFDSGPPLLEAMVSGSLDMGALGAVPVMRTTSQEIFDLRVISVLADVSGPSKVVSNGDIESIEDLRGKKVSIPWGTLQHYLMGKALEQHGMTFDDVDLVQMEVLDAQAAFIAKRIDAFVPAPSALARVFEFRSDAKILFEADDFTDPYSINDLWVAPESVLDTRLEEIQKVLSVFHKQAVPYFNNEETAQQAAGQMKDWLNKVVGASLNEQEVKQQIAFIALTSEDEIKSSLATGDLASSLLSMSEFLMDVGILKKLPDFNKVIDTRAIDGI